jgi:hypothetical protein
VSFPQVAEEFLAETGVDPSFVVVHVEDWTKQDGATGQDCADWDAAVGTDERYPVLCEPTGTLGKDATTSWSGGLPYICVVDPDMTLLRCGAQGLEWALDELRAELGVSAG